MKRVLLLALCCVLSCAALADFNWNVESGDWDVGSNWSTGYKPDNSQNITIGYSSMSVCTIDTDEGMFANSQCYIKNGQTLNIVDGGRFGTKWTRWADGSSATIHFSGNGTYVLNDDDLYFAFNGNCVVTMSDTSTITVNADTDNGEELYIGDGGNAYFQLNGSGITVEPDRIHLGYQRFGTFGGDVTLEYVLDAGGLSTIVTKRSYIGEAGTVHLVITDPGVILPAQDIVLIEATEGYSLGGGGAFNTMNGGPAAEGSLVVIGGNVYSLTYAYEANGDGKTNDVALVYEQTGKQLTTNPVPANGTNLNVSPTTLSWINPDPNDGASDIVCTVYFGMSPADPNRNGMDSVTLAANANSVEINAANFPTYGAQPIEDANDFYWVVDCVDTSPGVDADLGKSPVSWSFSTLYNIAPIVDAGPDQIDWGLPRVISLAGVVSDDGLPNPPGSVTITWELISGPASAVINAPDAAGTTVDVTESGVYVFELAADDGYAKVSDTVQVIVGSDSCEASILNGEDYNEMDFNHDCKVNLLDFADFAEDWGACTNLLEGC